MRNQLGYSSDGDFDQLSLAGVDFGEDYTQDHGINPHNLESEDSMYENEECYEEYDANQLSGNADFGQDCFGAFPQQMSGVSFTPNMSGIPAGLQGIPSGLGYANQMGYSNQMGSMMETMNKELFTVGGIKITYLHAAALLGLGVAAWKMGYTKKLGLGF